MWLESTPGIGSTFSFSLPLAMPSAPLARPERWINEEWLWRADQVKRQAALKLPYRERLIVCDGGGELYTHLTHCDDEIEFVATPDLDHSLQTLADCPAHALIVNVASADEALVVAQQAAQAAPDTPVVVCSFHSQLQRARVAGAVDYLIKPVLIAPLQAAIQRLAGPIRRVLVVDDTSDFQQLLMRMLLTCDGVETVRVAASGQQALAELAHEPPDLVLLDIVLPDMTGWEILACKNRQPALAAIPVIILSAQDPTDQPVTSGILLSTIGAGFSVNKLLHFVLKLSALLLRPEPAPDPTPGETVGDGPAWPDSKPH
jgi:CheY-like chemotaxis protein